MRARGLTFLCALCVTACFGDPRADTDASASRDALAEDRAVDDTPSALDGAARDAPDDVAASDHAPADLPAPGDGGPGDVPASGDGGGCIRDEECTDPSAPQCDTSRGRCVRCLPSRDPCAPSEHCDPATMLCVPGCRSDEGCAAEGDAGARRCDTTRHTCIECARDDDCPSTTVCVLGACVAGCSSQRGCAAGETCCEGTCHDITSDPAHCGACGRGCSYRNAEPRCAVGACAMGACTAPYADCDRSSHNGCEVDTSQSVTSCGACGNRCPTPPNAAAARCDAGRCAFTCAEGFADCDGDATNGCEVDLRVAPRACGRCGNVCAPAPNAQSATCTAGRCGYLCDAGRGDCDGDAANGCEVDTSASALHCGACGTACASGPHARPSCSAGRCRIQCDAGWADCDGDPANGCEVDVTSSAAHCGGCRRACSIPGATAACVASQCVLAACGDVFTNCDGNAANGCEADLRRDAAHCGACNRRCASAMNAAPICNDGECTTECQSGFGDCDGNRTNGCERDLRSNPSNCGACGRVCSLPRATAACSNATCAVASCVAGYGDCDGNAANGCETNLATSVANCGACGRRGVERCDGADNDCDDLIDEGCPAGLAGVDAVAHTSPTFGNRVGSTFDLNCPAGTVARGMSGRASSYVTQISIQCGRPRVVEDRSGSTFRYTVALDAASGAGPAGVASGTAWSFTCPGNSVIGRIDGRTSGSVIYQLSFDCFDLSVTGTPSTGFVLSRAAASASSPNFGPNSGSAFSYDCPSSPSVSVLRGLFGSHYPIRLYYMSSVGARCARPSVTVR